MESACSMELSGEARVRLEVLEAELTEVDDGEEEEEAPQHGRHLQRPAPAQQPRLGQQLSEDDIQDHPGRQTLHHLHWLQSALLGSS